MKKIDRWFLLFLIIVPLLSVFALVGILSTQSDVSPEDSSALNPVSFPTAIRTPGPDRDYEIQPVSPTPSPTKVFSLPEGDEDESNTQNDQAQGNGDAVSDSPGNGKIIPEISELPETSQEEEQQQQTQTTPTPEVEQVDNLLTQEDVGGLNTANIVAFSALVALFVGAFVILGSIIRKRKAK